MQPLLSRIIHGNLAPDQLWPKHFDGICQSEKIIIPPPQAKSVRLMTSANVSKFAT